MISATARPQTSRLLTLGLAALLGLALAGPASAQDRLPDSSSAQALGGAETTVSNYGRVIDLHYPRMIVASDSTVTIFNVSSQTGWVQEAELVSLLSATPTVIHDVAIEGNLAAIAFDSGWASFFFYGSAWQRQVENTSSGPGFRVEILDDTLYLASTGQNGGFIIAYGIDENGVATSVTGLPQMNGETVVEFAVGRRSTSTGSSPGKILLLSTLNDDGVTRTVRHLNSSLEIVGTVAIGNENEGFGDTLAVDEDWIWIGAPSYDAFAVDAGRIEVRKFQDPNYSFENVFFSQTPGDQWGRSLDADGGLMAFGETEADLVPNGAGVGAVRLVRYDASTDNWALSGESIQSWDGDYTTPDDFGAAVAVNSVWLPFIGPAFTLAVGEPSHAAGSGRASFGSMSATSHLEHDRAPGLAGESGIPDARASGWTEGGQPFRLGLDSGAANSPCFLVLGLSELSAPFKGGTLFPSVDVIKTFSTNMSGQLELPVLWPSMPGPVEVNLQFWIQDAAGPAGFSASEGISVRQDHA